MHRTTRACALTASAAVTAFTMSACSVDLGGGDDPTSATGSGGSETGGGESGSAESGSGETGSAETGGGETTAAEGEGTTTSSSDGGETTSSTSAGGSSESATGDTAVAPAGTKKKFGEAAVVTESSSPTASTSSYRVQVDSLTKAPDSVYSEGAQRSNGTVYYLRYKVTNIGKNGSQTSFDAGDVNSFMLVPKIPAGQQGRKLSGETSDCRTDTTQDLAVNQTGQGCDIYQVKTPVTEAVWKLGSKAVVTWSN